MILPAVLAKLNKHRGEPIFERAIESINSANEEGLQDYEVEVDRLDPTITLDIVIALESIGYGVTYTPGDETLYVTNE